jgi:hypothetical protein
MPNPAGIGDNRDAFPLRQMIDREVEVVPSGAGKARSDLVIQADLGVPLQRALHRRLEDIVAFLVGDPPLGDDADDVVGQFLNHFDHRGIPPTTYLMPGNPPAEPAGF